MKLAIRHDVGYKKHNIQKDCIAKKYTTRHTHTHSIQQVTHKEKLPIYTQPTQFEIWIKPTYIKSMFDSSVA